MQNIDVKPTETHVKETKKGGRLWIEGSKLAEAGFNSGVTYSEQWDRGRLILRVSPTGRCKVSDCGRPVIDKQSRRVSKYFTHGATVEVRYDRGAITFLQRSDTEKLFG